jgi:hypothetical protein
VVVAVEDTPLDWVIAPLLWVVQAAVAVVETTTTQHKQKMVRKIMEVAVEETMEMVLDYVVLVEKALLSLDTQSKYYKRFYFHV